MSYLVLARKYRPRTFSALLGQEHVVQALTNALESRRLHHAYLFTGTRGVGKTTVSRILAKSLNCQGADGQGDITSTPCGVCQACKDIDAGRFVDYTELDAASNRSVDEVQALLEQAVYKPVQGRFKVFMIDEVHMLTGHAFNAMLKTLEEPPEYLKFVLATTDPQKVPVTVLSRCLQFNLRPMAPETIYEHLTGLMQNEAVPADAQALRLLARFARGSMRDALSLTDQAIAFGNGKIETAGLRQMLGSVDRSYVFTLIDALALGDGKKIVETAETLRQNGLSAASTLEEMVAVLHRIAVLQAAPGVVADEDPDTAELVRLAHLLPADETQLLYSICLHGRADLGLAPDEYAALTMVLLRLLAFKPAVIKTLDTASAAEKKSLKPAPRAEVVAASPAPQPDAVQLVPAPPAPQALPVPQAVPSAAATWKERPLAPEGHVLPVVEQATKALEHRFDNTLGTVATALTQANYAQHANRAVPLAVREANTPYADTAGPANAAPVVKTEEGDFWQALVKRLVSNEMVTALVRELAMQSQLVARDSDQWILRVERESLNQAGSRDRLQTALQLLDFPVKVVVEVGRVSDSPAKRLAQALAERQLVAEKLIFEDPFVQSMLRDFGGKIVPGTIKAI